MQWVLRGVVVVLVLLGLYGIADALNPWVAIGVGALALLAVWRGSWLEVTLVVLRLLGAVLIAFLALVGVDVLLNLLFSGLREIHPLRHLHMPIPLGLVLALAVFAAVAYWYLRQLEWSPSLTGAVALGLALLAIVVAPYLYGKLNAKTGAVPESAPVGGSKLDLLIVGDGDPQAQPPELPPSPALGEFEARYSVGYADGDTVRWTLADSDSAAEALRAIAAGRGMPAAAAAPVAQPGADRALVLLTDGSPPVVEEPAGLGNVRFRPGEVQRWRAVAAGAAAAGTPTFALLQSTDGSRLARWKRFGRTGTAVSLQSLESQTATDAAVRLAVSAPTAQADFALAMRYRPILLFDHGEPVPWPLSVTALFNEGTIELCHDEGVARTDCGSGPIRQASELVNGGTHLRLKLRDSEELRQLARWELRVQEAARAGEPGVATGAPGAPPEGTPPAGVAEAPPETGPPSAAGTAIYVHPVTLRREGRDLLYLDYWWYLPDNPVALGGGALCGAGLVIAGVTCQSHQSDWEGMTVVVDRGGREPRVVAVQYAQHDSVVRYRWGLLRRRWDDDDAVARLVAGVTDASVRPLAFVARGTHATYPLPCAGCSQVANGGVGEEPHRGDLPWVGDDTGACGKSSCLQMLPTHASGTMPALWNAYEGTWGEHDCFLTYYCDSGTPPTAPGHQHRYQQPARYSGFVGTDWRFHPVAFEE